MTNWKALPNFLSNGAKENRRKVIMTHDDLDGISCKIVGSMFMGTAIPYGYDMLYPDKWVHVYHSPKGVDAFFRKLMHDRAEFSKFTDLDIDWLVTDLNVTEPVAKWINILNAQKDGPRVYVLDHHSSGIKTARFPWCVVDESSCAAQLLFQFLESHCLYSMVAKRYTTGDKTLLRYVNAVNAYDLGDFNSSSGEIGILLNRALAELGWRRYSDIMINALSDSVNKFDRNKIILGETIEASTFPPELLKAAKLREEKDAARYESMLKSGYRTQNIFGHDLNALVFIGSSFGQDVNIHRILTERPEIDIIATINLVGGTVSMRSIRPDLDLEKIASKFGGGGHKNAAAFKISPAHINIGFTAGNKEFELNIDKEEVK